MAFLQSDRWYIRFKGWTGTCKSVISFRLGDKFLKGNLCDEGNFTGYILFTKEVTFEYVVELLENCNINDAYEICPIGTTLLQKYNYIIDLVGPNINIRNHNLFTETQDAELHKLELEYPTAYSEFVIGGHTTI